MKTIRLTARILVLVLLTTPAFAGIVETERDGTVHLLADGQFKTVPREADEGYMVFGSGGTLLFVNPVNKTYGAGTVDEYCQAMDAMAGAYAKAMGQAVPQGKKPVVTVVKKGTEKIAGYATTHYAVTADGAPYEEFWITTDPELVGEFGRFDKLAEMMACSNPMSLGAEPESDPAYVEVVTSGLVLKEIDREGEAVTDVVKIERQQISPAEFEPPAGYRKTTLPEMFGGM